MIHELRIYTFRSGTLARYLPLAGGVALAIRGPELGRLRGFWLAKRGDTDIAYHLWAYDSLDHRQAAREALIGNARWNDEFLRHILPLLQSQEVRFLAPAGPELGTQLSRGDYRLDTYDTAPGQQPALLRALQEAHREAQIATGISPWPNSVTVLCGGRDLREPIVPAGGTLHESIRMAPASFSPLQ